MTNIERLKAAYKGWHDGKGENPNIWLDLFSDEVDFRSMGGASDHLAFAANRRSKADAVGYFAGLAKDWSMIHWTPQTFVCEGNLIAVFGSCAWTNRATGKRADVGISHLWQFENGRVTAVTEIFDSARAVAAATP